MPGGGNTNLRSFSLIRRACDQRKSVFRTVAETSEAFTGWSLRAFHTHGAELELGDLTVRIERVDRKHIRGRFAEVERNENATTRYERRGPGLERYGSTSRPNRYEIASTDAKLGEVLRMHLDERL